MNIITEVNDANKVLSSYKGSTFQIVLYSESLRRIAVRLFSTESNEIIYLIGVGCERINGPFHFLNANLSINVNVDKHTNDKVTIISDKVAGFELITSAGFSLSQGKEVEFGTSFENFIIDKKYIT